MGESPAWIRLVRDACDLRYPAKLALDDGGDKGPVLEQRELAEWTSEEIVRPREASLGGIDRIDGGAGVEADLQPERR